MLRLHRRGASLLLAVCGLVAAAVRSDAAGSKFILNEANSISGGQFIDKGRGDSYFALLTQGQVDPNDQGYGRLEGHGQNWFEFLVVEGDDLPLPGGGFSNTLDLRGWSVHWKYEKQDLDPGEGPQFGEGTITFTDDPLWAAVPKGTLLTVSEWQKVWYQTDTSPTYDPWEAGGLQRAGGINGLGNVRNAPYDEDPNVHVLLDLSTDTTWNPHADDWHMHVWAGERNPDDSFKYFDFTISVTEDDETYGLGTNQAGLFAVNNDGWQWTIKNAAGVAVQGPYGEDESPDGGANWGVNPTEIIKLEGFEANENPIAATYMNAGVNRYRDGSTGSFGDSNSWSSGGGFQDLSLLRNWVVDGDADLDGVVDGSDFLAWQRNVSVVANADLRQGDLTGDGAVDGLDLAEWKLQFGAATPATAPVPEPQAWALAALAAAALWGRPRMFERKLTTPALSTPEGKSRVSAR